MSKETQFQDFKKEVEKLREIDGADEYAKQLAHLFLGNGLSLQTILLIAIEFGQQHPAWVSVEKELPKERGKLYLVCDKYGRVGESAYDVEDDIWYRQSGMLLNPTHWMPLPTPPVKKGGE